VPPHHKGIEDDNIVVDDPADPDPCPDPDLTSSKISQSRRDVIGICSGVTEYPFFIELHALIETRKETPPLIPVLVQLCCGADSAHYGP
jgi:hypothetical protein